MIRLNHLKFTGPIQEFIFISEIVPERMYMFDQDLKTGLSIIWNKGKTASFEIDGAHVELGKNCILFLAEFHKIKSYEFERLNVIQFNKPFYCVENHDSDVGCRGVLFFGGVAIPKIKVEEEQLKGFLLIWEILVMEMEENDALKLEMLRVLLKRFLILSLRVFTQQHYSLGKDSSNVGLIREYNYLVEKHFRAKTKVSDYANMLFKSPKTLSNVFKKYVDKRPIQVINERRLIEAKRLLKYSESSIQDIADQLSFNDIHSFSQFFKKHTKQSPSKFRIS
jgi:AraC family transcriptional activator of pobA